jgi:hypothetical protein
MTIGQLFTAQQDHFVHVLIRYRGRFFLAGVQEFDHRIIPTQLKFHRLGFSRMTRFGNCVLLWLCDGSTCNIVTRFMIEHTVATCWLSGIDQNFSELQDSVSGGCRFFHIQVMPVVRCLRSRPMVHRTLKKLPIGDNIRMDMNISISWR